MIFYRLCNMYTYIYRHALFKCFISVFFKESCFFPSHVQLCFDCERFSNKCVEFLKRRFSGPQLIDKFSNWADDVSQKNFCRFKQQQKFCTHESSRYAQLFLGYHQDTDWHGHPGSARGLFVQDA